MIKGFSKQSKEEKINTIVNRYLNNDTETRALFEKYWNEDTQLQQLHDDFTENTLSNFYLPFGISPNYLINGKEYCIPMVTEESSVVAAASKAANFWYERGGFSAKILGTKKIGHVHFLWEGSEKIALASFVQALNPEFFAQTDSITSNMKKRGGGISDIHFIDKTHDIEHYFQLEVSFETCDSMGANFINSVLEKMAEVLKNAVATSALAPSNVDIVMCILSNYTPECLVEAQVSCPINRLVEDTEMDAQAFAKRFATSVQIAQTQPYRAVTHNKGIMNGIDAVVIASGNDFRAVEACAHAYAARNGKYSSLTSVEIQEDTFTFKLQIPLALGTVGGITGLHPLVKLAHKLLQNPNAEELMMICACVGLAQNFSALRSLTTTGIQQGHMKMHLLNILNQLGATDSEKEQMIEYFKKNTPHHAEVVKVFQSLRSIVS